METVAVPLTQGKVAIIDEADALLVCKWKWRAKRQRNGRRYYAIGTIDGTRVYMHRFLLGVVDRRVEVDHRDHDGLNNTRDNLRLATTSQNQWNARKQLRQCSSKFKGVSFSKDKGRWHAQMKVSGRRIHIGYFATEEDAARAYDRCAFENCGEFAKTNFPFST